MAYRNLIGLAVSGTDFFKALRDFLCSRNSYSATGIGWTLHDAVYAVDENTISANDYFVIYSAGENGKEDFYFRFKFSSASSLLYVSSYLYWNATTHAGVNQINSEAFLLTGVSGSDKLWIYGNLDHFIIVHFNGTSYYAPYFGKCDDLAFDDTVAICSGALSSGTDVTIAVDTVPVSWFIGMPLFIRDNANIKKITIKTLVGNTITADLPVSFSAGAKLRGDHSQIFSHINEMAGFYYGLISHDGNSGGTALYLTAVTQSWQNNVIPDVMYNETATAKYLLYDNSPDGYYGTLKDVWAIASTGRTAEEVLTDRNGNLYRYFPLYSNKPSIIREV